MEENRTEAPAEEKPLPKFRGLYRHVKISVKALDMIIVACIAVLLIVFAVEMLNPGLTITFDSKGGTDVESQTQMYDEKLELPQPPTREGYSFTGWYIDPGCTILWNVESDTIQTDTTLYAGWQKNE
jgi:uncharacterized repeat protein (TIGR02543 family)